MEKWLKTGLNSGLIAGLLLIVGVICGLTLAGAGRYIILAGVLVVAFSDAISDAFGYLLNQNILESKSNLESPTGSEIKTYDWQTFITIIFSKLIVASTFLIPLLLTSEIIALYISLIWSLLLLLFLAWLETRGNQKRMISQMLLNLAIFLMVVAAAFYIGRSLSKSYLF